MIQQEISLTENERLERLNGLEKRYRRSQKKIWFGLSIPGLWLIGYGIATFINELWAWEALVGWCLLTTFLVGVYVLYQVPSKDDVVHEYSQQVLPVIFQKAGAENVRVAKRHNLSMKTFLEAGLYYDKYSSISREDCIQGNILGSAFGMYEVAVQIGSTMISAQAGTTASAKTNQFYGWFLMIDVPHVSGFHFITLRERKISGESDDWLKKTISHWENDKTLQRVSSENKAFDERFLLNSDHPHILQSMLSPAAKEFLLHLAETTTNSFAISIQRSTIYLLTGHENAQFRKCPARNFASEFHPEMEEDARWFVELIRGLQRMTRS